SQYPQPILVQFTQAKCDELNTYQVGQQATISINLRGKEYQDKQTGQMKYFNTIQGWRIAGSQQQPQQPQQGQGYGQPVNNNPTYGGVQNYGQQQHQPSTNNGGYNQQQGHDKPP